MTTNDSANASGGDLRMDAYYYSFVATGVFEADRMLCAVASAGKAYHNTECWLDDCGGEYPDTNGSSPAEWIQNAANEAAARIHELEQQVARDAKDAEEAKRHTDAVVARLRAQDEYVLRLNNELRRCREIFVVQPSTPRG